MTSQTSPTPVTVPVTAENYAELAKPFIEAGMSRMICRLPNPPDTRRQWGAWLAYFLKHRIPARMMGLIDQIMVPAEWPHMFDARATVQHDNRCGEAFIVNTRPGKRSVILVPDDVVGFTTRRLSEKRREPFRPYPRLWELFADDPEALMMLDTGMPFEFVTRLSHDMATGTFRDVLRERLVKKFKDEEERWEQIRKRQKPKAEWCFPYKEPKFDISDFPDAPERP